jgi:CO dehydrogenase/acetyl-CoA synthase alpha subunit
LAVTFCRSGFADVVVLDEQCVRTDVYLEAEKVKLQLLLLLKRTA